MCYHGITGRVCNVTKLRARFLPGEETYSLGLLSTLRTAMIAEMGKNKQNKEGSQEKGT